MATASSRDTASESSLSSHEKHSTSAPAAAVAADSDPTVAPGGGDNSGKASQNYCIAEIGVRSQSPSQQQNRHNQQQGRLQTSTANSKRSRADRICSSSSSSSSSTGSSSCSSRGTGDRRDCAGSSSSSCSRSSSSRSSSGGSRSRSSSVNSRSNGCSSKGSSGGHCDDAARDDQSLVVHVDVSEDNLDSDLNVRRAGSVSAAGGHQSRRSRPTPDIQQQQKKPRLQPRDERQQQEPSAVAAAAAAADSQPLHRPVKGNRGGASTSGDPPLVREPPDGSRLQPSHQPLKKASKSRKKIKGKKPSKPGVQNLLSQSGLLRVDPAPVKRLLAAGTKHRSLWISGLSISTKVSDLRTMFGQYGKVMSASIIKKEEERSLTFHGIVTLATAEEADRCRSNLNGSQYRGRMLEVITHVAATAGQMSVGVNKGNETGRDRKPVLPRNRSPDCLTSGLQPTGEKHQSRDAVRQAGPKQPEMVSANPRERSPLQRAKPEHRGAGSTDRFVSQDRVLQQLHCIADETQRLKEARAKLVADKEFLRSERQLAEMTRSEFGDVCRQRLRLEREVHELQARCARERTDLMRLQEQRARELPPPPLPLDYVRREEMLTAPASSTLPAVGASPAHNSDRTAAGWAGGWQQATPDASFPTALGVSMAGHRAAIQGPGYSTPSVSTDQLLCIGGVLYRVGGGDGNVLVLSRLAVDMQPVVIPGISRVLNQPPVDSAANFGATIFPQGRDLPLAVQHPMAKEPAADRHCSGSGTSPGLLADAPQRRSSGGDTAAAATAEQIVSDVHVAAPGGS